MSAMNALRAILTLGAVIAAVVGVVIGSWTVVGWMAVAIVAHGAMFYYQHRSGTLSTSAPRRHSPQI